ALGVANAYRPSRGHWTVAPSFFASWLTTELAPQWFALLAVITAVSVTGGALDSVLGVIGLVLALAAAVGLGGLAIEGLRTRAQVRDALAGLNPVSVLARFPRWQVALPFLVQQRPGVRRVRNIPFARVAGRVLHLDLTLPSDARPGEARPVVLQ